jgi:hypothetical protein
MAGCGGGSSVTPGVASNRKLTPAQQQHVLALNRRYSNCMQTRGVPNFPDPTIDPDGRVIIAIGANGPDPNSPQFQRAGKACHWFFAHLP